MNDSNKSSNGLLVLKLSKEVPGHVLADLTDQIAPLADRLGVEPLVVPLGLDVELKMGSEALLLRVCEALEKIAAQGEPPVLETQEGPSERPTLNARPGTLNSRQPIYDGLSGNGYQPDRSGQVGGVNPMPPAGR